QFNRSASNLEKAAHSIMEIRNTLNQILAENTGQRIEVINEAVTFDNYMTAEQAINFGICDEIKNIFLTHRR
ncbi:MAG: ATP-dependent Clp protease proteolytic subunit, partial [Oscillospiraceae bacterium]|nr:ATP-dependent Clp protease proteolytic subunit [Oscillospiraceae bacterium]